MSEKDFKVKVNNLKNKVKIIAGDAYSYDYIGKPLATLKDTENGFIIKIHSYSSMRQDKYICLEYDEAEYIYEALKAIQFGEE
jgi:hypothetical protein